MKKPIETHGLDTQEQVFFYEQDYYVLSNFSSFTLQWKGLRFDTSEAAYHWEKFPYNTAVQEQIRTAPSAHEAYQVAFRNRDIRRNDWDAVKVEIMRDILMAKVQQHEYVRRKLLATGDRELVENSWRDDFWGWGPNRDGANELGQLWMSIRAELVFDGMSQAEISAFLEANGVDLERFRKECAALKARIEKRITYVFLREPPGYPCWGWSFMGGGQWHRLSERPHPVRDTFSHYMPDQPEKPTLTPRRGTWTSTQ